MDDRELALECLKIAAGLVSPTVSDRVAAVAQTQKFLYDKINEVVNADTPRRGRPPKSREEVTS
jgi:hypothetical protein